MHWLLTSVGQSVVRHVNTRGAVQPTGSSTINPSPRPTDINLTSLSVNTASDFFGLVQRAGGPAFITVIFLFIRFWSPSATVVSAELFSHGTETLRCLQKEMATYRRWSVSLWRDPDDVTHCQILSPYKTEWRLISAILCGLFCGWPIVAHDTHTRRKRLVLIHQNALPV